MEASARKPVAISKRIARQLQARLVEHRASGDAFVVSVYGEWGIGKTRCLNDIHQFFDSELDARIDELVNLSPQQWVVPVLFDPWQYEHEAHLIVPLLKTIEHRLGEVKARVDEVARAAGGDPGAPFAGRAQVLGNGLLRAGEVLGDVAVALLSAFKFGFAPLKELTGLEIGFEPKDAIEAARKADELRKHAPSRPVQPAKGWFARIRSSFDTPRTDLSNWASKRESLYFDVRQQLAGLTRQSDTPLRFVVLIDDLDRCLPEKAIQVLESVKLFLNASGFSFVLAVDDEVVERGIAHRYKPYLGGEEGNAPISGAEYLEKIVHLPVHLQRWTEDESRDFLRREYPKLFGVHPAGGEAEAAQAPSGVASTPGRNLEPGPVRAEEMLDLVVKAVPLVPRKLIRLAEATEFMLDHFMTGLQAQTHWHPLHALRMVALQQLYPALYRHLRLRAARYWRMFDLTSNDYGEPAYRSDGKALHVLRKDFEARRTAPESQVAPLLDNADTLRERLDLLALVNAAGQQRGSPNPISLFGNGEAPLSERDPKFIHPSLEKYERFAQLYIHGVRLQEAMVQPPPAAPMAADDRVAAVADVERLLSALSSADTVGRREYLQSLTLDGRLPDGVFDRLMTHEAVAQRVADIEWLRDTAALLNAQQLLALYRKQQVLEKLLASSSQQPRDAA